MFSSRRLVGSSDEEIFNPPFRCVDYGNDPAVHTVSTRLRQAWLLRPELAGDVDFSDPTKGAGKMIRAIQNSSEQELVSMRNQDKETVHTGLRDSIYHMWNHVFWDASKFLAEVNCNTGMFQPPAEEVLTVQYPVDEDLKTCGGTSLVRVQVLELDTNILLSPIFVDSGVKMRVVAGAEEQMTVEENELHESTCFAIDTTKTDGDWNESYICWVGSGRRIQIYLGGDFDKSRSGVAAVFVRGNYVTDYEPSHC
jgi:hypothetical protein